MLVLAKIRARKVECVSWDLSCLESMACFLLSRAYYKEPLAFSSSLNNDLVDLCKSTELKSLTTKPHLSE